MHSAIQLYDCDNRGDSQLRIGSIVGSIQCHPRQQNQRLDWLRWLVRLPHWGHPLKTKEIAYIIGLKNIKRTIAC